MGRVGGHRSAALDLGLRVGQVRGQNGCSDSRLPSDPAGLGSDGGGCSSPGFAQIRRRRWEVVMVAAARRCVAADSGDGTLEVMAAAVVGAAVAVDPLPHPRK